MNIFGKQSNLPLIFSRTSDPKKEKSLVSFTHDQSIICSQTQLDDIAHEQTIICRSSGAVSGNEKEEKLASNDKKAALIMHRREKLCFSKAKFSFYHVSP